MPAIVERVRHMRTMGSPILYIAAIGFFSAAAVSPRPTVAAISAILGLASLGVAVRRPVTMLPRSMGAFGAVITVVVLLIAAYQTVGPFSDGALEVRGLWVALIGLASVAAMLGDLYGPARRAAVVLAIVSMLLITLVMALTEWRSDRGVDVYLMHQAAGEALLAGHNPYGEAVRVPNGSPFAEPGSMITGYPYPPVTAVSYGLVGGVGDSRVVSLIAWALVAGWLAVHAIRRDERSQFALAVLLIAVTAPVWPVIWFAGWIEPLSVVLLLAALLLWRDRPVASAILLGLMLATKQYFVFLAPLVLMHGAQRMRRATITLATVAMTVVPFALADPSAYFQATIGNLLDIGFRPDTQSVSGLTHELGLTFELPNALWVAAGIGFIALIARKSETPGDFAAYVALGLGFAFVIGQAFPNYWWLVMATTAIAAVLKVGEGAGNVGPETTREGSSPESSTIPVLDDH